MGGTAMYVLHRDDREETKIETYPYKGQSLKIKDVWIRWLSKAGPDEANPDYGLRYFRIAPGGYINIHNHFYYQTMYMLTGQLSVRSYDLKTDAVIEEKLVGPHQFVFVPSMEPHSMKNLSDTETATFLCCIANVFEDEK
jgi:quercetin dioxygenase-like cupin family protein